MSRRFSCAVAVTIAVIGASAADARTKSISSDPFAGARNSVSTSRDDVLRECSQTARQRWPSSNQEMQTNRDFALKACMTEHGQTW